MIWLITAASWALLVYCAVTNLIYCLLLFQSVRATIEHRRLLRSLRHDDLRRSPLTPPIAILVPARNEERSIVQSVRSLLALDYPEIEVIVINDGSTDNTLGELEEHFDLIATDILQISEIPTGRVKCAYLSIRDRRLLVLDKESCGRKADALNAGLNAASAPFICAIDGDSILEGDALLRIMAPALHDPAHVIGSGGLVRAVNGCAIENGQVKRVLLPRRLLEALQVLEYLRSFLLGRLGWARMDMLLIISGAFGVFRRDVCREIGGFRPSAIGEDMDLIVRLHRHCRVRHQDYRIAFVPDPVCWTEVPSTYRSLGKQRARWQNGLADVLWGNRDMILDPRFGKIGFIGLPYQWVFELIAPVIEVIGWTCVAALAALGLIDRSLVISFLLLGYLFSCLLSIGAVLIEEMVYHRYNKVADLVRLIGLCFLEPVFYRFLNTVWRIRGLWDFLAGHNSWDLLERKGFTPETSPPRDVSSLGI